MRKKKHIGTYVELHHLPAGLFTANDAGRAPFDINFIDKTLLADAAVVAGKIGIGAIDTLSILVDNFFSGLTGLSKFATGFFTKTDGRAKFEEAFINNALIENLNAEKIDAGFLSAARIEAGSLNANKITAHTIASTQLRTDIAIITETVMIADLKVTSAKCAALLGIKSAELPVVDPDEYFEAGTSYVTKTQTDFSNYAEVKHQLLKCTVKAKATEGNVFAYVLVQYSIGGGAWTDFAAEQYTGSESYVTLTFTGNVTTELNQSFRVRFQIKKGGLDAGRCYIKSAELTDRKFLGKRMDI